MVQLRELERGDVFESPHHDGSFTVLHTATHPEESGGICLHVAVDSPDGEQIATTITDADLPAGIQQVATDAVHEVPNRLEVAVLKENTVLTKREAEVIVYRDRGLGRKEIAEMLDVSPNTVDSTRQSAIERLQAAAQTPHLSTFDPSG